MVKFWRAVHQLALPRLRESEVEPPRATLPPPERPAPAETVSAPPFTRRELPMVEVATTEPLALVERRELVREEMAKAEVVPEVRERVPRFAKPETVRAVDEAYGKVEAMVVEVATR